MTETRITDDGVSLAHTKGDADNAPVRKTYTVTKKAARETVEFENGEVSQGSDGIFKNGKTYKPGDEIELDEKSAAGFLELGEIE